MADQKTENDLTEMTAWQVELERREHLVALSRKNAEAQGTKAAWRIVYNNEYEVRAWLSKRPASLAAGSILPSTIAPSDPGYDHVVKNAVVASPVLPPVKN